MAILILSTSANEHAKAIYHRLIELGGDVTRFNFDEYSQSKLGFRSNAESTILLNDAEIQPDQIQGVFVHHPIPPQLRFPAPDSLDSSLRAASWRNSIDWFENTLKSAMWINRPSCSRLSASVLWQLNIATSQNLRVPETIFTNEINQLKAFAARHQSIVIKTGPLYGINLVGKRILTRLVNTFEIEEAELRPAPCLFQEYVEKAFELRIHVVGKEIYACKIESQKNPHTRIDWRNYRLAETPHTQFELDNHLADSCRAIVTQLGLGFGIIDAIVTPSGETVFLECNSQGHWLWIEELTGLPITDAVAKSLLTPN